MALKPKKYTGSIPRGEKWESIAEFTIGKNDWEVFIDHLATAVWQDVKVVCIGRITKKANYWFKWNGERMSECADAHAMMDYRPDLYAKVMSALTEKHGGVRDGIKASVNLPEKGYKIIGELNSYGVIWDVHYRPPAEDSEWSNYVLEARQKIMKTNKIYVGWNGERFAINTSIAILKSMTDLYDKFMDQFIP